MRIEQCVNNSHSVKVRKVKSMGTNGSESTHKVKTVTENTLSSSIDSLSSLLQTQLDSSGNEIYSYKTTTQEVEVEDYSADSGEEFVYEEEIIPQMMFQYIEDGEDMMPPMGEDGEMGPRMHRGGRMQPPPVSADDIEEFISSIETAGINVDSTKELLASIKNEDGTINFEQMKEIFGSLEAAGISKEEIQKFFQSIMPPKPEDEEMMPPMGEDEEIPEMHRGGRMQPPPVNVEDIQELLESLEDEGVNVDSAKELLASIQNEDGTINFEQMKEIFASLEAAGVSKEDIQKLFQSLMSQKTQNGKMMPPPPPITADDIDELIASLEEDGMNLDSTKELIASIQSQIDEINEILEQLDEIFASLETAGVTQEQIQSFFQSRKENGNENITLDGIFGARKGHKENKIESTEKVV